MLHPVDRASSTHRRYSAGDVNWVVFLTRLRSTSMPIARVRDYVDLVRAGDATVEQRRDLLLEHRVFVRDYEIRNYEKKVDEE
jgi:DNA-binding transcriptional MerR regulator